MTEQKKRSITQTEFKQQKMREYFTALQKVNLSPANFKNLVATMVTLEWTIVESRHAIKGFQAELAELTDYAEELKDTILQLDSVSLRTPKLHFIIAAIFSVGGFGPVWGFGKLLEAEMGIYPDVSLLFLIPLVGAFYFLIGGGLFDSYCRCVAHQVYKGHARSIAIGYTLFMVAADFTLSSFLLYLITAFDPLTEWSASMFMMPACSAFVSLFLCAILYARAANMKEKIVQSAKRQTSANLGDELVTLDVAQAKLEEAKKDIVAVKQDIKDAEKALQQATAKWDEHNSDLSLALHGGLDAPKQVEVDKLKKRPGGRRNSSRNTVHLD